MRSTLPVLAATTALLTVTGAGAAMAAPPLQDTITIVEPAPVTTCADGETISVYFDVSYRQWETFAEDGTPETLKLNMVYTGAFVNDATGDEVPLQGTRSIVFDFVNDSYSDSGNHRTLTQPGEGWVLKRAGRYLSTASNPDVATFISGPDFHEMSPGVDTSRVVCGLFGLEGTSGD
ncbi:hypothetical protein [Ornithinimicrobium cerasi]|uniref:Uncharacterized protein n=1 Tax=Ornithinimicrobium cerasi TaxID=2248773 RepID=A0A285VIH6_9MICO|nr:hypothetical protein [Ornithinimicrobium cerasi]SOC52351.1 hypothetical protein SAMN05421879_101503 [Ornithinimicrobium cerasi]